MNVGVFLCGDNHAYHAMAKLTIASVRATMPDVEVHHLTDEDTPTIEGVDSTRVFRGNYPLAVRRMLHHSSCTGDWLFIDCDVIVQKDVRAVFDEPFDVAITNRDGTITTEGEYAAAMPYNIGVTFSRSQAFWMFIAEHLQHVPAKFQEWEGDQRLICELIRQKKMPFNVKVLPGHEFNYPPKFAGDGTEASIVHYKGNRKAYLLSEVA